MTEVEEFYYRVAWRTANPHPGGHLGRHGGDGGRFRRHGSLLDHGDPRRLDVRASWLQPWGELKVRLYDQASAIDVYALVDVSASMAFGRPRKLDIAADFIAAAGYSAHRSGDAFGLKAAGDEPLAPLDQPPRRGAGLGARWAIQLRRHTPQDASARGLLTAARELERRRSLVFILSDFHFSAAFTESLLDALEHHDLVAVWLADPRDIPTTRFGLATLADAETGQRRLVVLRPGLTARLGQALAERRRALAAALARRHLRPLLALGEGFCPDRVTQYFCG